MVLIEVKDLVKTYKTIEKEDGLLGYFKNLVRPIYKEFTAVISRLHWRKWSWEINYNKNVNRIFDSHIWKSISKWNST